MEKERIEKALNVSRLYGDIDGSHHKMWVIDQMVRALCGSDDEYAKWVRSYEMPDDDRWYEWDMGIAP